MGLCTLDWWRLRSAKRVKDLLQALASQAKGLTGLMFLLAIGLQLIVCDAKTLARLVEMETLDPAEGDSNAYVHPHPYVLLHPT